MPTMEEILGTGPDTLGPERARPDWALKEEDFLKKMDEVPLFMRSMPENAEDNITLQALQALAYDGTPEEIAENFKNQGNDSFISGPVGYQDAIKYYTQALEQKCDNQELNASCYLNRAAVNLALQNYRRVLNDCSKALSINPNLTKGYYRSAKALYALDKIDEALDCIDRGSKIEPENKALPVEKEKCIKRKAELEKQRRAVEERKKREQDEEENLVKHLNARGIRTVSTTESPQDAPHKLRFDPETSHLVWPVFFLYPEYKESDFIQGFDELSAFEDHINLMFEIPPPWDTHGTYVAENLEIFFESTDPSSGKAGLVKVGKQLTLLDALKHPKYIVNDRIPNFIVLPKTGDFREEFVGRYRKKQ